MRIHPIIPSLLLLASACNRSSSPQAPPSSPAGATAVNVTVPKKKALTREIEQPGTVIAEEEAPLYAKLSAFAEAVEQGEAPLEWREVKRLLVEAFESPQYQVMKRFELQELRRKLLEWVLAYYRDFIEQRGDDPAVREDLVESHMRVADILSKIGSRADALAAVEQARKIQERLLNDNPQAQEYQRGLSSIYSHLDWLRDGSPFFLLTQRSVQKELKLDDTQVTKDTPPTFLFHTKEDTAVVIANSELYYAALKKAGVPAKMVTLDKGRHGVGLGDKDPVLSKWPGQLEEWLRERKMLPEK